MWLYLKNLTFRKHWIENLFGSLPYKKVRPPMNGNFLFFCVILFPFVPLFAQEETKNPHYFSWNNGFTLESAEKDFRLKFGGRMMVDHAYLFQDRGLDQSFGPLASKSGTEIRRARLVFSGVVYKNVFFKFQVDFAGGQTKLKDVYIGLRDLPIAGKVMIGHFKEPIRLSSLTSSKYTTFMEPGQNAAFAQSRNNGILIMNDFLDQRLSAQFGAFRNANNNSDDAFADDGYVITGRITGLAIRNAGKRQLLHLGAAYSYRKPESGEYQVSLRPGAHLAPKYSTTGTLGNVKNINLVNFETAYVHGPFSFQGEYLSAVVNTGSDTFAFSNYYGQASFFITGESKKYKSSYEGFDRVKPNRNFGGKSKSAGAWEVAIRYSETDLIDKSIVGGKQSDVALGLNWYMNPATRLMVNYIWTDIKDQGIATILQGRIQIDF